MILKLRVRSAKKIQNEEDNESSISSDNSSEYIDNVEGVSYDNILEHIDNTESIALTIKEELDAENSNSCISLIDTL